MAAPVSDAPQAHVPDTPRSAMRAVGAESLNVLHFARQHAGALSLVFLGVLLPLWVFAALVGEVHEQEVFAFDAPLLNALHAIATPTLDTFFSWMSKLGFLWGVIPLDVAVVLWLALRRRSRPTLFFGISVVGSAILNVAAKNYFARMRPSLWLSITPETTYSFPSGHAMGSATLGVALVLLFWRTRWCWLVTPVIVLFVLLVGVSRVYLGVHYPSDILAGWAAAMAWVVGIHQLVDRTSPQPAVVGS
jgi:membrane-associated phospholipid phosphatase